MSRAARLRAAGALAAVGAALAGCGHRDPAKPPPAPAVVVSPAQVIVAEGGAASFEARLAARPGAPVEVEVRSGDPAHGLLLAPGYAVPGAVRQLTFNPEDWDVPRRVVVFAAGDRTARPNPPYDVTLAVTAAEDPRLVAASAASVRVTSPDDDVPGFTVSRDAVVTSEVGTRATFEVRLTARPAGRLELDLRGVDRAETTVSADLPYGWTTFDPDTARTVYGDPFVVFGPDDWEAPHAVTLAGVDDGLADGERTFTLSLGPAAWVEPAWQAVPRRQIVVTNRELASDEGTAAAPVELGAHAERWSEVGTGVSHYVLRGAEGVVAVTLDAPTGDVALAVDADGDFSAGVLCASDAPGTAAERCEVAAPGDGVLHVRVSGGATSRGAAFLLRVNDWIPSPDAPRAVAPAGWPPTPTASTLTLSSGPWTISKVRVRLDLSLADPTDFAEVTLVSPAGTRVELTCYLAEGSFSGTVFDDAAPLFVYQGTSPYAGTFRPAGSGLITDPFNAAPLSALAGETARGAWRLEVVHFSPGATLGGWSLEVR